jgi:hypothetical protein
MTVGRATCALALLVAGLAGCAAPASPSAGSPATTTAISPQVTLEPSRPPREPTDKIKNAGWVVGTVTTGGSGPCYSLVTDDGTQYALHSADGKELVKGTRMRIRTETALVRIACGPGKLVEMTAAEPLR